MFSTWGSDLSWRERSLLAWIAPRGIVAAAVSALFTIKLQHLGMAQAQQLLPLTFIVIIGTVILQSATARPIAVALKVAEPDPVRSEEHTSELQSLMRNSYAVFCLKKK